MAGGGLSSAAVGGGARELFIQPHPPETKVEALQEELGSPAAPNIFIFTVRGPSEVKVIG